MSEPDNVWPYRFDDISTGAGPADEVADALASLAKDWAELASEEDGTKYYYNQSSPVRSFVTVALT